ncbi:IS30 family transposase [Eubacterium callanderi]|uniref:IS30 family transposase n=1 Tax=Eubacterium callanderi TaxID=53442 RepID=UPI003AF1AB44
MSHYKHLTPSEREKIYLLYAQNYSLSFIANSIGRNKSTVSRELARNSNKGSYSPSAAQAAYVRRRKQCKPKLKLSDPTLYEYVRDRFLKHQWSPEQIAGRFSLENADRPVSYTTIYRAIYAGMFDTKEQRASHGNRGAIRQLRHRGKTRQTKDHLEKRGKIPISHAIADRPAEANKRCRLGDWEADTVIGKKAGPCLVTLTDRKSRFLLSRKAEKKASVEVRDAMIQCLTGQPCFSITPDRGKEFARHGEVSEALNQVPFYFPLPHHPWQRGTNENTNGLLREYFPKGFDLRKVTDTSIQNKVDELNKRPRKCLGFKTPYEIYYSITLHLT